MSSRQSCYIKGKIAVLILFLVIQFGSIVGILSILKEENLRNHVLDKTKSVTKYCSYQTNTNNNQKKLEVSQTENTYSIPWLFFFATNAISLVILIIFLLADGSGIRYAKLDELHSIKKKLLKGKFRKSFDITTKEKSKKVTNSKTEAPPKKDIITKSKVSNRAALLKQYMDCVTEI